MRQFIFFLFVALFSVDSRGSQIKKNDTFPSFELAPLRENKDKSLELTDLLSKNKVIILDFWASWCEPCKEAMPILDKLQRKFKGQGLVIVGINVDGIKSAGAKFIEARPVQFPLVFDKDKKLVEKVGVNTMPTTYILDKSGKVHAVHKGYRAGDYKIFENEIKQILKIVAK